MYAMKEIFMRQSLLTYIVWVALIVAFVLALYDKQWIAVFVSALTFLLTMTPFIIQRRFRVYLPSGFLAAIVFFIYATIYLGELHGYYVRFWWWDIVLHTGSALGIGFVGVVLLIILYKGNRMVANPGLMSFFAFSFAIAIGVLWEIFEFAVDQLFGLNMQKSGLTDTMWDLIVDSVGATIASLVGYLYLKRGSRGPLTSLIGETVTKNVTRKI